MEWLKNKLNRFFFPPENAAKWVKILPYAILGLLTVALLSAGAYGWDYTNSSKFCGESCHTMPPEYTSYLISPHARIACVECHIGRDFIATQFTRKAGDLRHVFYTVFKKYEFPITANDMRPARESCEKCHFPEKFSNDSLIELKTFGNDRNNTPISTFLILKTGGGTKRQGLGKGIHWHVENRILYYAPDRDQQVIPYVRVYDNDGNFSEYTDIEAGIDPGSIPESELKEMDCITCHNRITHLVNQPEDSIDKSIQRGAIDIAIPEFRRLSIEALRATYTSQEQAMVGIAALEQFYKAYYPEYYNENQEKIIQAVAVVQDIYRQSVYLEQKSDWNSHSNNIGHLYTAGCFRCHDGKHLNEKDEAIRLECNLCHSIPVVAGAEDFVTDIEISRGPEPDSHLNPNWISMHREVFDSSCSTCHNTGNPGGIDNTSFCSNSACHSNVFTYAGFDAPGLRAVLQAQLPPPQPEVELGSGPLTYEATIGPLLTQRCGSCHAVGGMKGLDVTSYTGITNGGEGGPAIIPGDSAASLLIQVQTDPDGHFAQLNAEELEILSDWIDQGAPEK